MNLKSWAENEVEIACKRERDLSDNREDEFDYGCECYKSALKAFNSLLEDEHSGLSIRFTKNILDRLIDGKLLTPVEDKEDEWEERYTNEDKDYTSYRCKRMSALFKDVFPDGKITYTDVNRVRCVCIDNPDIQWSNAFITEIIDEMFPISFPYYPSDNSFVVYEEEFLTDRKNGDYDTFGLLYVITPTGDKVDINRYFKETDNGFVDISKEEYEERKAIKINEI